MSTRRPKVADTIRWMAENGLRPRVTYYPDGRLVVEAKADNDSTDESPSPSIADRINAAGVKQDANNVS